MRIILSGSNSTNQYNPSEAIIEKLSKPKLPFTLVSKGEIHAAAQKINSLMAKLPKPAEKLTPEVVMLKDCLDSLFRKPVFS